MFYRQKILLALIELFDGKLSNLDLEKHLFLFCQTTGRNYYDFFPYRFGPFSFTSYDDKRKLIERGILKEGDSFQLASPSSYFSKLNPEDRQAMRLYIRQFGMLNSNALLHKTYYDYPQYTTRSEIAGEIFTPTEYEDVKRKWSGDTSGILLSLGYEGITIDQYLAKLISKNVTLLVDVRQNPYSHKHGFSQKQLLNYIQKAGIEYIHLPQLGIPSNMRKGLDTTKDYKMLFEHYASDILPQQHQAVAEIIEWVLQGYRVALTCFEADHSMCHRHKITDLIAKDIRSNFPIIHL